MTENQTRVHAGIPTGGQFAATAHSDAVPSLETAPRVAHAAQLSGTIELHNDWFDELPEWPAALPEPEINFGFDDGKVETYVTVDGKMKTFWNSDMDGVISDDDSGSDNAWEEFDEVDQELAKEWAAEVHKRIDSATYGVMIEGSHSPAVKDIILAQAVGKDPAAAKPGPDLTDTAIRNAYVIDAAARLAAATNELQSVYMIGAAQELREEFPVIDSFTLVVGDKHLEVQEAWDADGNDLDKDIINAASQSVFRYRDEDDFNTFTDSGMINVEEAIGFRPGI
jgi:hypothetical protein